MGRAIDCYVRGIETDDLIEAFHRGQMRCLIELGQRAEAMSVFVAWADVVGQAGLEPWRRPSPSWTPCEEVRIPERSAPGGRCNRTNKKHFSGIKPRLQRNRRFLVRADFHQNQSEPHFIRALFFLPTAESSRS